MIQELTVIGMIWILITILTYQIAIPIIIIGAVIMLILALF